MHSTRFFFEVRLLFKERRKFYPKQFAKKYFAILWVAQEILKVLPSDPPWDHGVDRKGLQELQWDDSSSLRSETSENTRLILVHHPQIKKLERLISVNTEPPKKKPLEQHLRTVKREPKMIRFFRRMVRKLFKIASPETVEELMTKE
jgi:hypothetical protein